MIGMPMPIAIRRRAPQAPIPIEFDLDLTATAQDHPIYDGFTRPSIATYRDNAALLAIAQAGVPRLHHDAAGAPVGLLIEPQRTNFMVASNDLSDTAIWTRLGSIAVQQGGGAPDGSASLWSTIVSPGALGTSEFVRILEALGFPTGVDTAFSIWIAPIGDVDYRWRFSGFLAGDIYYDPGSGEYGPASDYAFSHSEPWAGDLVRRGWVAQPGSDAVTWFFYSYAGVSATSNGGGATGTADGTVGLRLYGAQIETGGDVTSYIPTSGAAATRAADQLVIDFESLRVRESGAIDYAIADGDKITVTYADGTTDDLSVSAGAVTLTASGLSGGGLGNPIRRLHRAP